MNQGVGMTRDCIQVRPSRLAGRVAVTGAKNSVLKLMAASLLAPGRTVLRNVPDILDVQIMAALLRRLGCDVESAGGELVVDVPDTVRHEADYDLVRRLRASICVLGPLLVRCGETKVALPGGDNIGSRGLDLHIAGLCRLGAEVTSEHGYLVARAPHGLSGATVWLDFPSVGATENLLMAAVLAQGTTVIDNAAGDGRQNRGRRNLDPCGARSRHPVTGHTCHRPRSHRRGDFCIRCRDDRRRGDRGPLPAGA